MGQSIESFIKAKAEGHTWERRPPRPEDERILAQTGNWLKALPLGIRPVHLQREFPRIAKELARLWAKTSALDLYFQEIEFSPREDRQGFAPLLKEELLALHLYSLRTRPLSPWQSETQGLQRRTGAILGTWPGHHPSRSG